MSLSLWSGPSNQALKNHRSPRGLPELWRRRYGQWNPISQKREIAICVYSNAFVTLHRRTAVNRRRRPAREAFASRLIWMTLGNVTEWKFQGKMNADSTVSKIKYSGLAEHVNGPVNGVREPAPRFFQLIFQCEPLQGQSSAA